MKINKTFVGKAAPKNDKQQTFYRDDELKGFALRVTQSGVKSFVVEKKVHGKVRRITLGKYPALTAEMARKQALLELGQMALGHDPVEKKHDANVRNTTLNQAYKAYLIARKDLKPRTLKDYDYAMNKRFADWKSKPLVKITKEMIEQKHRDLGENHGSAQANQSMRFLRAIFNFAIEKYTDHAGKSIISDNPVNRLSAAKAWYRIDRRSTLIESHQLSAWYDAVMTLDNSTTRDYFLFLLFTGLRKTEAAKIKTTDIDLKAKTFTIPDPKNHNPHTLPLSDFLYDIVSRRMGSEYVFSGDGKHGYIIEVRAQIKKVTQVSGVEFCVHDLRRTFITIAESLDIPAYALKRLLNHKMTSDVTAGYIVANVERLRRPMQHITDYLLKTMSVKQDAEIIDLSNYKEIMI